MGRRQQGPGEPPEVRPLDVDGVRTVAIITVLWGVAFVVLALRQGPLNDAGRGWWLWTCLAGVGLGLLGLEYCRKRRDAIARAALDAEADAPDEDDWSGVGDWSQLPEEDDAAFGDAAADAGLPPAVTGEYPALPGERPAQQDDQHTQPYSPASRPPPGYATGDMPVVGPATGEHPVLPATTGEQPATPPAPRPQRPAPPSQRSARPAPAGQAAAQPPPAPPVPPSPPVQPPVSPSQVPMQDPAPTHSATPSPVSRQRPAPPERQPAAPQSPARPSHAAPSAPPAAESPAADLSTTGSGSLHSAPAGYSPDPDNARRHPKDREVASRSRRKPEPPVQQPYEPLGDEGTPAMPDYVAPRAGSPGPNVPDDPPGRGRYGIEDSEFFADDPAPQASNSDSDFLLFDLEEDAEPGTGQGDASEFGDEDYRSRRSRRSQ